MTVWETQDLPVLEALNRHPPDAGFLTIGHDRGAAIGLDMDDAQIHQSILNLRDAGYISADVSYVGGGGAMFQRLMVTGRGQQALGEWPLFTNVTSPATLARLLDQLADEVPKDQADDLRRVATYVRSITGSTLKAAAITASSYMARAALGF